MEVLKSSGANQRITESRRLVIEVVILLRREQHQSFSASSDWETGGTHACLSSPLKPCYFSFLFWQGEAGMVCVCYPSDTPGLEQPSVCAFFPPHCFVSFVHVPGARAPHMCDRKYVVHVANEEIMCCRNNWDWPVGGGGVGWEGLMRASEWLHVMFACQGATSLKINQHRTHILFLFCFFVFLLASCSISGLCKWINVIVLKKVNCNVFLQRQISPDYTHSETLYFKNAVTT